MKALLTHLLFTPTSYFSSPSIISRRQNGAFRFIWAPNLPFQLSFPLHGRQQRKTEDGRSGKNRSSFINSTSYLSVCSFFVPSFCVPVLGVVSVLPFACTVRDSSPISPQVPDSSLRGFQNPRCHAQDAPCVLRVLVPSGASRALAIDNISSRGFSAVRYLASFCVSRARLPYSP